MFEQIKNKLLRINRAFGVEISLLPNDKLIARVVILKLERNKVIKEKESQPLSTLGDLQNLIPAGSPVAVAVNGKGVLHKKIDRAAWSPNVLESILPNANPADFYQDSFAGETFYSVHIIRRAVLDGIVDQLVRYKFRVLAVSLGSSAIQFVLPYINAVNQSEGILTNHHTIYIDTRKNIIDVETISPTTEEIASVEYNIGDQYVSAKGITAFASAMGLLAGAAFDPSAVQNATLATEKQEFRYFKYFKAASWALLSLVFAILMVNFLLFMHYSGSNAEHAASLLLSQDEQKKTAKLEAEVQAKEGFLDRYGWDRTSRISFYADRIAALVPDDALLTGLKINPIITSLLGGDGLPRFQQDTIQISGTCEEPAELNRFANNLRNISDFREINIKSYLYKKETQNGLFSMEIITP
jgi:Tfp pilus assembly protein PilN